MTISPTNVSSSNFVQSSAGIQQSSERIASGRRINNAEDDAAGLAIANRLSSQINEFSQSVRNGNDGISYLQTADGALSSITENLQRIRELALQASNGTLNSNDRKALNAEAQQLKDEITRTVETTEFNGQPLLNNSDEVGIQLGAESEDRISLGIDNFAQVLEDAGLEDLDLTSASGAADALSIVDDIQTNVDSTLSTIGAQSNRIDSSINSLLNREENAAASRSRIEDADIAKEASELTANTIRRDISIALQAQANSRSGNVLRLLGSQ